jgi:uncharacterized SAM-binding protein YcdF (DUF218 family)
MRAFVRSVIVLALGASIALVSYVGIAAVTLAWDGSHNDAEVVDAIVVLGAAQYDGAPSPLLASRLQHALDLWKQKQAPLIAVTGGKRSAFAADIPAIAETIPGIDFAAWYGLHAPLGTPQAIIDRLNRELTAIVATADFRTLMDKNGAEPISNTPEQFGTMIRAEVERYGKVVKAVGIKLD